MRSSCCIQMPHQHLIYLDHAATTPLRPEVWEAMRGWLEPGGNFANPASDHAAGRQAAEAVEKARAQVAALVGAQAREMVWTSGATEANNLAIKGAIEFNRRSSMHVVTSRIEHKCVLDACRWLESSRNARVTYLEPDALGRIDPEQVLQALTPDTLLVSLMWVNNEIGNVTDIARLAPLLRQRGVMLHVDAAQATGKIEIDLEQIPIDLMSLSAHKLGGPKGVGALFVRRKPRARVAAQMHGGGHEWGMRSGTLATHQIVGMGAAAAAVQARLCEEVQHMQSLRDDLASRLLEINEVVRNGDIQSCAPHILNLSFPGVEGESLRAALPQLAVSSGAACSSATSEPSYVLRALGRDDELANASLRLSVGPATSVTDIESAARMVAEQVQRLRALCPSASLSR